MVSVVSGGVQQRRLSKRETLMGWRMHVPKRLHGFGEGQRAKGKKGQWQLSLKCQELGVIKQNRPSKKEVIWRHR